MSRQVLMRILEFGLVALIAVGAWNLARRRLADRMPSPEMIETMRLMKQWDFQASRIKVPMTPTARGPKEAVELMNAQSAQIFPGRSLSFVLWESGQAAPPGFVVNPLAASWAAKDLKVAALRLPKESRFDLRSQTSSLLKDYGYRCRLIDGKIYVFRRDAFLPHPVTMDVYFSKGITPPPAGGFGNLTAMFQTNGITMGPGTSATYLPESRSISLRVDESEMDRAYEVCLSRGAEKSAWKDFQKYLRTLRNGILSIR